MSEYPFAPSHGRTDTSSSAAAAIAPGVGRIQSIVLEAVRQAGGRGLTTNEIAEAVRIDRGTVQPRTSELRRLGKIVDSGDRRPNANGKQAIVWRCRDPKAVSEAKSEGSPPT